MANYADFALRATGPVEGIDAIRAAFDYTDETVRHFCRIDSSDVTQYTENADGTATLEVIGLCAWSAYVCMTADNKINYPADNKSAISIEELSDTYGLTIEVHDSECGMEFATRIIKRPGEPLEQASFDYQEICYEEGFDDLDDLIATYDLTEAEVEDLKAGEAVTRTDMDFDDWSI